MLPVMVSVIFVGITVPGQHTVGIPDVPEDKLDRVPEREDAFADGLAEDETDEEEIADDTDEREPQTSVQLVCVRNGPPRKTYPTACNSATSVAVRFKHVCTILLRDGEVNEISNQSASIRCLCH